MRRQFTLGKNEKLKSRKQIELLFSQGKKFVVSPYRIFYQLSHTNAASAKKINLQFGVAVSTKNFKKASDRNRIKRLTREAWRLQKNELKENLKSSSSQMNVFLIYTNKELPDLDVLMSKVKIVLAKLSDKIDEIDSANS